MAIHLSTRDPILGDYLLIKWRELGKIDKTKRLAAKKFVEGWLGPQLMWFKQWVTYYGPFWPSQRTMDCECIYRPCPLCLDTRMRLVPAFHTGMGKALRIALRANGFGEKDWPIPNLKDYYLALVEAATGKLMHDEDPERITMNLPDGITFSDTSNIGSSSQWIIGTDVSSNFKSFSKKKRDR